MTGPLRLAWPHEVRAAWSKRRRRWVCGWCARRVRFRGGTEPFHRWWWRWWD